MQKLAEVIYVPVMWNGRDYFKYNGKSLSWWYPDAIVHHEYMLTSAFYAMKDTPTRESANIQPSNVLFGDSGGYQKISMEPKATEHLTPDNVIAWQQKVCNIGIILDVPPTKFYTQSEYDKNLIVTKKNGDRMRELHTNRDLKLFDVIHGKTPEDMERWWKETTQNHDFDGYSLPSRFDIDRVALALGFAIENLKGENKPIHILGTSRFYASILLVWASQYLTDKLYYDSQSYLVGQKFRKYINYFDLGGTYVFCSDGYKGEETPYRVSKVLCPCPACRQLKDPSHLWNVAESSGSGGTLSMHNLFWQLNFTSTLEELLKHGRDQYMDYVRRNFNPSLLKLLEFIDDTAEGGLDHSWSKHFCGHVQKTEDWI